MSPCTRVARIRTGVGTRTRVGSRAADLPGHELLLGLFVKIYHLSGYFVEEGFCLGWAQHHLVFQTESGALLFRLPSLVEAGRGQRLYFVPRRTVNNADDELRRNSFQSTFEINSFRQQYSLGAPEEATPCVMSLCHINRQEGVCTSPDSSLLMCPID